MCIRDRSNVIVITTLNQVILLLFFFISNSFDVLHNLVRYRGSVGTVRVIEAMGSRGRKIQPIGGLLTVFDAPGILVEPAFS